MAFIVGAVIGAVGAIGGAIIGGNAAQSAADTQASAANNATQAQLQMFNTSVGLSAPSRNLGYGAMGKLAKLYGINPGTLTNTSYSNTPNGTNNTMPIPGSGATITNNYGTYGGYGTGANGEIYVPQNPNGGMKVSIDANGNIIPATSGTSQIPQTTAGTSDPSQNPDYSDFYNSPGFQFARDLGNQAIQRQAAAGGGLYSANTMTQLSQYNTGFAAQHYNDYVNQLLTMAGLGSGASTATGNQAVQTGASVGNNYISAGNAQASGILGNAGAIQGGISGVTNAINKYYQNQNSGLGQIDTTPTYSTNSNGTRVFTGLAGL